MRDIFCAVCVARFLGILHVQLPNVETRVRLGTSLNVRSDD